MNKGLAYKCDVFLRCAAAPNKWDEISSDPVNANKTWEEKAKLLLRQDNDRELEETAAQLREFYALQKDLTAKLPSAPANPSAAEKRAYETIITPWDKETDRVEQEYDSLSDQIDRFEDPKEMREFITKVYRPFFKKRFREHIKTMRPTMIKFYNAVKTSGSVLSKPYTELLLRMVSDEVRRLQSAMDHLDKMGYNDQ